MSNQKAIEKPKVVSTTTNLLLTYLTCSLLIGVIINGIKFGQKSLIETSITNFLVALFYFWLIRKISNGRNWARITYVTFIAIGTGYTWLIWPIMVAMYGKEFSATSVIIGICVNGYVLMQLFSEPSSSWFKAMKSAPPTNTYVPQQSATVPTPHSQQPTSSLPQTPLQRQPTAEQDAAADAQAWEQVAEEMERGHYEKGLWAKNFVAANGDEAQAKLQYMQARQQQIYTNLIQIQTEKQLEKGGQEKRKCTCGEGSGGRHWQSCELANTDPS